MKRNEAGGVIRNIFELPFKFPAQLPNNQVVRHTDGMLYVAFAADDNSTLPTTTVRFVVVARLGRDYRLDLSYGTGGFAQVPLGDVFKDGAPLLGMAVQPDGSVTVLARYLYSWTTVALTRFKPDGSQDEDFGEGGWLYIIWMLIKRVSALPVRWISKMINQQAREWLLVCNLPLWLMA